MTLRLAFLGTPDFAVPTLAELIAQGHDIAAVYSPAAPSQGARAGAGNQRRCRNSPKPPGSKSARRCR